MERYHGSMGRESSWLVQRVLELLVRLLAGFVSGVVGFLVVFG